MGIRPYDVAGESMSVISRIAGRVPDKSFRWTRRSPGIALVAWACIVITACGGDVAENHGAAEQQSALKAPTWTTPRRLTQPATSPIRQQVRVGVTAQGDVGVAWVYQNGRFLEVQGRLRFAPASGSGPTGWLPQQRVAFAWTNPPLTSLGTGQFSLLMAARLGINGPNIPVHIGLDGTGWWSAPALANTTGDTFTIGNPVSALLGLADVVYVHGRRQTITQPPVYELTTLTGVLRSGLSGLAESYAGADLQGVYSALYGDNQDVFFLRGVPGFISTAPVRLFQNSRVAAAAFDGLGRAAYALVVDRATGGEMFVRLDTIQGTVTHRMPLPQGLIGSQLAVQPATGQGYLAASTANGAAVVVRFDNATSRFVTHGLLAPGSNARVGQIAYAGTDGVWVTLHATHRFLIAHVASDGENYLEVPTRHQAIGRASLSTNLSGEVVIGYVSNNDVYVVERDVL